MRRKTDLRNKYKAQYSKEKSEDCLHRKKSKISMHILKTPCILAHYVMAHTNKLKAVSTRSSKNHIHYRTEKPM